MVKNIKYIFYLLIISLLVGSNVHRLQAENLPENDLVDRVVASAQEQARIKKIKEFFAKHFTIEKAKNLTVSSGRVVKNAVKYSFDLAVKNPKVTILIVFIGYWIYKWYCDEMLRKIKKDTEQLQQDVGKVKNDTENIIKTQDGHTSSINNVALSVAETKSAVENNKNLLIEAKKELVEQTETLVTLSMQVSQLQESTKNIENTQNIHTQAINDLMQKMVDLKTKISASKTLIEQLEVKISVDTTKQLNGVKQGLEQLINDKIGFLDQKMGALSNQMSTMQQDQQAFFSWMKSTVGSGRQSSASSPIVSEQEILQENRRFSYESSVNPSHVQGEQVICYLPSEQDVFEKWSQIIQEKIDVGYAFIVQQQEKQFKLLLRSNPFAVIGLSFVAYSCSNDVNSSVKTSDDFSKPSCTLPSYSLSDVQKDEKNKKEAFLALM